MPGGGTPVVIKPAGIPSRLKRPAAESVDLAPLLAQKIVGQPLALERIVPYVQMYQAGLAPEGRPVGVFLLLGPTGTGKTRTVEALAEVLHGSDKAVLKIDCGEYQMDHEVAKLIGAPPGYLGHRETTPMLTQQKLNAVTSEECGLSLVLFDEIEKAAPSLTRLLLGVLDRGLLRLGDNTTVNFENSLIFFTSNLGAREMMKEIRPEFGFQSGVPRPRPELGSKLEAIGLAAVRRRFSPEFVNRIDVVITYQPLNGESLAAILDQQIAELQRHVHARLGERAFQIEVGAQARQWLLEKGTSLEYGARELKRTIHRHLTQPLAALVASGRIEPGSRVQVELGEDKLGLRICCAGDEAPALRNQPVILLVDDNRELVGYLQRLMAPAGWRVLAAGSAREAEQLFDRQIPDVALIDYLLPDGTGVALGLALRRLSAAVPIVIMSGARLGPEDEVACRQHNLSLLRKPFLGSEAVDLVRAHLEARSRAAA